MGVGHPDGERSGQCGRALAGGDAGVLRHLGAVLRRPSWLPVPGMVLRLALGELATVLTTGQRVLPGVAQQGGYRFRYPLLEPALRAIIGPAASSRPAA